MIQYLIIGNLQSSVNIRKNYLYSTKPLPDNNFCLNDCKFGGHDDVLISISGLGLCLGLLENNLGFFKINAI